MEANDDVIYSGLENYGKPKFLAKSQIMHI